ncbi:MAG TPA: FAD/NAD(P)-binding protein, partial [Gaiella sp.]|nr:FAD/NAD(P)-binding protein [Gaiella sp.]
MSNAREIAIVGAGFSGTTIAIHLLRASPPGVARLLLIERAERRIGGVAYLTGSASHTLNVPAGRMSAFEDDPDDFLDFARSREPSITGGSFVPRKVYGEYLASRLEEARRSSELRLLRVSGEVVGVSERPEGVVLTLGDRRVLRSDNAVLAIGNYPPADPPAVSGHLAKSLRYARDPWAPDALEVDPAEEVLLIGTGLTMVDVALGLRDADHRGRIHALSRRGLRPQPHRVSAKPPPHLDAPSDLEEWPNTALGLLRALRQQVRALAREGVDWREVVTSIRHDTPALWQRLDTNERRLFLDHLRPFWETHRHRASPDASLGVDEMIEAGRLEVIAGTLEDLSEASDGVVVTLRRRGTDASETLRVGKVINCTGPDTDLARVGDP